MADKARFSLRYQVDGKDEEFAEAHTLLDVGRMLLRKSRSGSKDPRCWVVFDREAKAYVEPHEMVKVYQKLMR